MVIASSDHTVGAKDNSPVPTAIGATIASRIHQGRSPLINVATPTPFSAARADKVAGRLTSATPARSPSGTPDRPRKFTNNKAALTLTTASARVVSDSRRSYPNDNRE